MLDCGTSAAPHVLGTLNPRLMKSTNLTRQTVVVLLGNVVAMILGFGISAYVAAEYGDSRELDVFFVILPIPLLAGQLIVSVALLVITPYYQRISHTESVIAAQRAVAPLFWMVTIICLTIAIIVFCAAGPMSRLLAPGISGDSRFLAIKLLRLASLSLPFVMASGFLQSIANANHRFLRAAWGRPVANACALALLVILFRRVGLAGYFWGLALGSSCTCMWQLREVFQIGGFNPTLSGLSSAWRAVRASVVWIVIARGLAQLSEVSVMAIASFTVGAIATYSLGYRIAGAPVVLAASVALTLFPHQSSAHAIEDEKRSAYLLWRGVDYLTLIGAASGMLFYAFAGRIVVALYERGDFTGAQTEIVSATIRMLAIGLPFICANNAFANVFWASGRLKTRVTLQLISIVLLIAIAFVFTPIWGGPGLALAYGAQFIFLFAIGVYYYIRGWRDLFERLRTPMTILISAAALGVLAEMLVTGLTLLRAQPQGIRMIHVAAESVTLLLTYVFFLWILRVPLVRDEIARARLWLTHRFRATNI